MMAKRKRIAILTGDIHLNDWNQFNMDFRRTDMTIQYLDNLLSLSARYGVPILNTGDFWHTPEHLTTKLMHHVMPQLKSLDSDIANILESIWGISGNHEMPQINSINNQRSPSLWEVSSVLFPNLFHNLDFTSKEFKAHNMVVYGLPYIDHNVGFVDYVKGLKLDKSKFNVLLVHTDLHGAKDPSGRIVNTTENIYRQMRMVFKKFDVVAAGHIHKPQKLGKNIYMIGSPDQQRRSDAGCQMGYWVLYDDATMRFQPWEAPQFKFYREGEEPEDDYNYWTMVPKPRAIENKKGVQIKDTQDRISVGKSYCKAKKVKSKAKKEALASLLKETED